MQRQFIRARLETVNLQILIEMYVFLVALWKLGMKLVMKTELLTRFDLRIRFYQKDAEERPKSKRVVKDCFK